MSEKKQQTKPVASSRKPGERPAAGRKARGGTLVGIFIGLVLGVVISTAVVWYLNKLPLPFTTRVKPAPETKGPQGPIALPGKPGDLVPKPQTTPPALETPQQPPLAPDDMPFQPEETQPQNASRGQYLQAGSFAQPQEADRAKANLAMKGLEASVQQVMVQDKTYYRVLLGPYSKAEDAGRVRAELAQAGIETFFVASE
jgi:cell division protein FtsN